MRVLSITGAGAVAMMIAGMLTSWTGSPAAAAPTEVLGDAPTGFVRTVAVGGDGTRYVGGTFTTVGAATGGGAKVDSTTGTVDRGFPAITGSVKAAASDGSGGYYIGGTFTAVNGVPRSNLAHITSAGNLDPTWLASSNNTVLTLAVSGSTVYIGGQFSGANSINGNTTRNRAAAVDTTNGTATNWDPNTSGTVSTLTVSGSNVYVGGSFSAVNQVTRNRVAAFDTNGRVTSWDPNSSSTVNTLAVSGSTVYLGGNFTGANSINGTLTRNRLAAVDATTGTATSWDPNVSNGVNKLAVSGSTVYFGGAFSGADSVNGNVTRNYAAAVDATTGTATSWDPNLSNGVNALAVSGSTVYLGGEFTGVNSVNGNLARNYAAAVDTTNGTATAWDPNLNNSVTTLAVSGSTVYLGGTFNTVNGSLSRNYAAALDTTNGTATAWDPNANSTINGLAVSGSTVYLGGTFSTINGSLARNFAAAVDTSTGTADAWNPSLSGQASALTPSGSTVFIGGAFSAMSGAGSLPGQAYFAATPTATALPPQPFRGTRTGTDLTWTPGLFGGVTSYTVLYREVGSGKAWANYATGANNTGVSLTNPGTRNTCSAANTALGYTSCPMAYGWTSGKTYEFGAYTTAATSKNSALPIASMVTYTAP